MNQLRKDIELRLELASQKLKLSYRKYVRDVSSPKMAISLEYACMLHALASDIAIEKALDLGSGFSTYVLLDAEVEVYSYDHDLDWAKKTGEFIGRDNFVRSLADLANLDTQVDLISYDIGGLQRRINMLPACFDSLASGGVMLIDDMHKPQLRPIYSILDDLGAELFDVKASTLDQFGRFAILAQKS